MKSKRDNSDTRYMRRAHHAGSWYDGAEADLDKTLSGFLRNGATEEHSSTETAPLRGLVVPHAGYSYSGATAAFAYQALMSELSSSSTSVDTILLLHPSHHVYLRTCAVSGAGQLETPLGNLTVNDGLRNEIQSTLGPLFASTMDSSTDENEHSGELQYPYIAKALKATGSLDKISVLPIMVGNLDNALEKQAGVLLAPIMARSNVVTIVSSDFCHWGRRFQYQPTGVNGTEIFRHVESLDREGMNHISLQEPGAFATYLKRTSNTICGRHAIAVWLHAIRTNREAAVETLNVKFVRYAQSSSVRSMSDSSVSYASAVATVAN